MNGCDFKLRITNYEVRSGEQSPKPDKLEPKGKNILPKITSILQITYPTLSATPVNLENPVNPVK
jgi:hypothetical protein